MIVFELVVVAQLPVQKSHLWQRTNMLLNVLCDKCGFFCANSPRVKKDASHVVLIDHTRVPPLQPSAHTFLFQEFFYP